MNYRILLLGVIIVGVIAIPAILFLRPQKKRKSDRKRLRGHEQRIYSQAKKLAAQGNIIGASQQLESINLHREAITILEKAGMINEAVGVLMRIGAVDRAGIVYARHGLWNEAASAFERAGKPLEVAKAAREAGDHRRAARNFREAGRITDAAESWLEAGDAMAAARLFVESGLPERAAGLYPGIIEGVSDINLLDFNERELDLIQEYVMKGKGGTRFADVLVNSGRLVGVIVSLIRKGEVKSAADLYLRSTSDIGPQLISTPDFEVPENRHLAEVFARVANFEYAGMVQERLSEYAEAGRSFEKAEQFERAAYCYERADMKKEAVEARIKLAAAGGPSAAPSPPRADDGNPFAMGEPTEANPPGFSANDDEQTIVDTAPPAPPGAEADGNADAIFASPPSPQPEPGPPPIAPASGAEEAPQTPESPPTAGATDTPGTFSMSDDDTGQEPPPATPPLPEAGRTPAPATPPPVFAPPVAVEVQAPLGSPAAATRDGDQVPFHNCAFLEELDFSQKKQLWDTGSTQAFLPGSVILDYHAEPAGVYFILSGEVACHRILDGRDTEVDTMKPSESFGEFWLLVEMATEVKFLAKTETRILVIDRQAFNQLLDKNGTIARKLYKRFTQKLVGKLITHQNKRDLQSAS